MNTKVTTHPEFAKRKAALKLQTLMGKRAEFIKIVEKDPWPYLIAAEEEVQAIHELLWSVRDALTGVDNMTSVPTPENEMQKCDMAGEIIQRQARALEIILGVDITNERKKVDD